MGTRKTKVCGGRAKARREDKRTQKGANRA